MSEEIIVSMAEAPPDADLAVESPKSVIPLDRERMPPIESRFMFVDIAALRAKQLRRGALPRVELPSNDGDPEGTGPARKLERIAMQELDEGLIVYTLPDASGADSESDVKEAS